MADKMFCYQCEQTAGGIGCTRAGVCGKSPETAALHDLLTHALKGMALFAVEGRKVGVVDHAADVFTNEALFATLTNVDFDEDRFPPMIKQAVEYRDASEGESQSGRGKG